MPKGKEPVLLELESAGTKFEGHAINKSSGFSVIHRIFFWDLYPREKGAVLLELESTGTKFEGHAINKSSGFSIIHN